MTCRILLFCSFCNLKFWQEYISCFNIYLCHSFKRSFLGYGICSCRLFYHLLFSSVCPSISVFIFKCCPCPFVWDRQLASIHSIGFVCAPNLPTQIMPIIASISRPCNMFTARVSESKYTFWLLVAFGHEVFRQRSLHFFKFSFIYLTANTELCFCVIQYIEPFSLHDFALTI